MPANRTRYFLISFGLRGAYMPDSSFAIGANARAELKTIIEGEAESARDGYTGASKRAVASLAAQAWANRGIYESVMPLKPIGSDHASYGLMVSNLTADEFAEWESNNA